MAEEYDPAFPTDEEYSGSPGNALQGLPCANEAKENVTQLPQKLTVVGDDKLDKPHLVTKRLTGLQEAMSGLVSYQSSPSTHGDDSGESEEENDSGKKTGIVSHALSVVNKTTSTQLTNSAKEDDVPLQQASLPKICVLPKSLVVVPSKDVEGPSLVSPDTVTLTNKIDEFEHLVRLDNDAKDGTNVSRTSCTQESKGNDEHVKSTNVLNDYLPDKTPCKDGVESIKPVAVVKSKDILCDMNMETSFSSTPLPPIRNVAMETNSGTKGNQLVSSLEEVPSAKTEPFAMETNEALTSESAKAKTCESDVTEPKGEALKQIGPCDILSVMEGDSTSESMNVNKEEQSRLGRGHFDGQKFTPRTVRMTNSKAKSAKKPPAEPPKKPPLVEWRIGFVRVDVKDDKVKEDANGEDADSEKCIKDSTNKDELSKKFNILPNLPKKDPMLGLTSEVKERLARAIAHVGESKQSTNKQSVKCDEKNENIMNEEISDSPQKNTMVSGNERSIFTADLSPNKLSPSLEQGVQDVKLQHTEEKSPVKRKECLRNPKGVFDLNEKNTAQDNLPQGKVERTIASAQLAESKGKIHVNNIDREEQTNDTPCHSQLSVHGDNKVNIDHHKDKFKKNLSGGEKDKYKNQQENSNNNGNHSVSEQSSRNTRRSRRLGRAETESERSKSPFEESDMKRSKKKKVPTATLR